VFEVAYSVVEQHICLLQLLLLLLKLLTLLLQECHLVLVHLLNLVEVLLQVANVF
jgi:hypothetical protein